MQRETRFLPPIDPPHRLFAILFGRTPDA
jgi:hypothetical protein